jgi:anti-sigma regulatory factor (Ser/Thr protein kinase)
VTTTAAAAGIRRHTGTYLAEPRQVGIARAALAGWLGGCPQADEAILIVSEFATNAVLHSASRHGGAFTLRAEVGQDRLRIEVEDAGGPWLDGPERRRPAARVRCRDGTGRAEELGHRRGRPRAGSLGQARVRRA